MRLRSASTTYQGADIGITAAILIVAAAVAALVNGPRHCLPTGAIKAMFIPDRESAERPDAYGREAEARWLNDGGAPARERRSVRLITQNENVSKVSLRP